MPSPARTWTIDPLAASLDPQNIGWTLTGGANLSDVLQWGTGEYADQTSYGLNVMQVQMDTQYDALNATPNVVDKQLMLATVYVEMQVARIATGPNPSRPELYLYDQAANRWKSLYVKFDDSSGSTQTITSEAAKLNFDGRPWTREDINNLMLVFTMPYASGSTPKYRIYGARIVVTSYAKPTCAPALPGNWWQEPVVHLQFAHPQGYEMEAYHVVAVESSTLTNPPQRVMDILDPMIDKQDFDTLNVIWDSGVVVSRDQFVLIPVSPYWDTPGVHQAFHVFAKVYSSVTGWSTWQFVSLNNSIHKVPIDPELHTITVDANLGRYTLGINLRQNMLPLHVTYADLDFNGVRPAMSTTMGVSSGSGVTTYDFQQLCWKFTSGGGTVTATTADYVMVAGSQKYIACGTIRHLDLSRNARVKIQWFDSSFASISTSAGSYVATTGSFQTLGSGTWTYNVTATAPSNALYAKVIVEFQNTLNTERFEVDKLGMYPYHTSNTITTSGYPCIGIANLLPPGSSNEGYNQNFWRSYGKSNTLAATPVVASRTLAEYRVSPASIEMHFDATATADEYMGITSPEGVNGIFVYPGRRYAAYAWIKNGTTVARVVIRWFDSQGQPIGTSRPEDAGSWVNDGTYYLHRCIDYAPPQAAFASVGIEVLGGGGGYYYADQVAFFPVEASVVFPYDTQSHLGDGVSRCTSVQVERSIDSGVTWTPVPFSGACGSLELPKSYTNAFSEPNYRTGEMTVVDDFCPPGETPTYRVTVVSHTQDPYVRVQRKMVGFACDPVTAGSLAAAGIYKWLLKDPYDTGTVIPVEIPGGKFTFDQDEDQVHFAPLGAPNYIVVADVVRARTFKVTFEFLSDTDYQNFIALREQQRPLFLQDYWTGTQFCFRIRENLTTDEYNYQPTLRQVTFEGVEVDVATL